MMPVIALGVIGVVLGLLAVVLFCSKCYSAFRDRRVSGALIDGGLDHKSLDPLPRSTHMRSCLGRCWNEKSVKRVSVATQVSDSEINRSRMLLSESLDDFSDTDREIENAFAAYKMSHEHNGQPSENATVGMASDDESDSEADVFSFTVRPLYNAKDVNAVGVHADQMQVNDPDVIADGKQRNNSAGNERKLITSTTETNSVPCPELGIGQQPRVGGDRQRDHCTNNHRMAVTTQYEDRCESSSSTSPSASRHVDDTVISSVQASKRHSLDDRRASSSLNPPMYSRRKSSPADLSRRLQSCVTGGATAFPRPTYTSGLQYIHQGSSSRVSVDGSSRRASIRTSHTGARVATLQLEQIVPEMNSGSRDVGKRRRYSAVDIRPNDRYRIVDEIMSRRRLASFKLLHPRASTAAGTMLPLLERRQCSSGSGSGSGTQHKSADGDPIGGVKQCTYNENGKHRRGSVSTLTEKSPELRHPYGGSGPRNNATPTVALTSYTGRTARRNSSVNGAGDLNRVITSAFRGTPTSLCADSITCPTHHDIEKNRALDVVFETKMGRGASSINPCHQQQQQGSWPQLHAPPQSLTKLQHRQRENISTVSDISDDQSEFVGCDDDEGDDDNDVIVTDLLADHSSSDSSEQPTPPASSRRRFTLSRLRQDSAYRSLDTQSSLGSRLQCYGVSSLYLADCDLDGRLESGNSPPYDIQCRPIVDAGRRKFSIDSRARCVLELEPAKKATWKSDDVRETCYNGTARSRVDCRPANVWNAGRRQSSPLQRRRRASLTTAGTNGRASLTTAGTNGRASLTTAGTNGRASLTTAGTNGRASLTTAGTNGRDSNMISVRIKRRQEDCF